MEQQTFKAGEIIFREGEDSDYAFLIVSGKVDIFKKIKNGTVLLASLGAGEIFGEMGIVSDAPRSASAAADAVTVVKKLDRHFFDSVIHGHPPEIALAVRTLMERLREANQKVSRLFDKQHDMQFSTPNQAPKVSRVTLIPLTGALKEQLPKNGQVISLPFRIGALPVGEEPSALDWNNLFIKGGDASIISRNHFAIQTDEKGLYVIDRGSKTGTVVNGSKIGGSQDQYRMTLNYGENTVIAGDENSPYRFCIVWE